MTDLNMDWELRRYLVIFVHFDGCENINWGYVEEYSQFWEMDIELFRDEVSTNFEMTQKKYR